MRGETRIALPNLECGAVCGIAAGSVEAVVGTRDPDRGLPTGKYPLLRVSSIAVVAVNRVNRLNRNQDRKE